MLCLNDILGPYSQAFSKTFFALLPKLHIFESSATSDWLNNQKLSYFQMLPLPKTTDCLHLSSLNNQRPEEVETCSPRNVTNIMTNYIYYSFYRIISNVTTFLNSEKSGEQDNKNVLKNGC